MKKEQITKLVENNKLVEAIESLGELPWNEDTTLAISIISSELNQLYHESLMNVISPKDETLKLNSIRKRILTINSSRKRIKRQPNFKLPGENFYTSTKDENPSDLKTVIEIQNTIDPNNCVLKYIIAKEELHVIVIKKDKVVIEKLLDKEGLTALRKQLKRHKLLIELEFTKLDIDPGKKNQTSPNIEFIESIDIISEGLTWRLFEKFSLPNRLYFTSEGFLNEIQLPLLTTERSKDISSFKSIPFLGLSHQVALLPSLEAFNNRLIPASIVSLGSNT